MANTPQLGLYLIGSLCIWVCKLAPSPCSNPVPGTKTLTKGSSFSPGLMGSWLKTERKNYCDTRWRGTSYCLAENLSCPRFQQNVQKVTGEKKMGEKSKSKRKTSKMLVRAFPSSITSVAVIATGSAAWDQLEFLQICTIVQDGARSEVLQHRIEKPL